MYQPRSSLYCVAAKYGEEGWLVAEGLCQGCRKCKG